MPAARGCCWGSLSMVAQSGQPQQALSGMAAQRWRREAACHGFVTSLLVFHIITSWTKEKNYVSQRTSRSEKEDTSRKIRHLVARGSSSLSLAAGRGVGVLSKLGAFIK